MSHSRLLAIGSVGCLIVWLFVPALTGACSFAWRDAAHYYHPLFEFIGHEWHCGRLPLWNPYENAGVPLAAENTSSVFYPGKLLFALPLDYTLLYNAYIASHVALAAVGSYRLARDSSASVHAAAIGAISYAFCGTVLFQYCNVVFLVGAAWLPCAALLWQRMLLDRRPWTAIGLGGVLALMVTGGDPQMAYNAGLLAALYAWFAGRTGEENASTSTGVRALHSWWTTAPALLAISAAMCLSLAAVQILPTYEAARLSGRDAYNSPRSIFELIARLVNRPDDDPEPQDAWYSGLLNGSATGHQRQIYQFSVGPWRACEYLWPNISGRQFPVRQRWLGAIPAEDRVWAPSLYMGLLPCLLAVTSFNLHRAARQTRWLSWMVLIGATGSLGIYGAGWAIREIKTLTTGSSALGVGDEVGGLYWLLTVCLPGYVYFRYPAKLLVISSLGLSMLAAQGWDTFWQSPGTVRRWSLGLLAASLLGLIAVPALWPWVSARLAATPPDPLLGPLDIDGAWRDIVGGLTQTTVILAIVLAVCWRMARAPTGPALRLAMLAMTVIDLAIAQKWLVAYAPAAEWRDEPPIVSLLPADPSSYRVFRQPLWLPNSWQHSSSPDRLTQALGWDRQTLAPKYNLRYGVSTVEASGTLVPFEYQMLLEVGREHGKPGAGEPLPHPSVLDLLAARVSILREGKAAPALPVLAAPGDEALAGVRPNALARAWIVHRVETLPELKSQAPEAIKERTEQVLFPNGQPRDWSQIAVVEANEPLRQPGAASPVPSGETCQLRHADPLRVEINACLASPGLVVLSDQYYPGWALTVETDGAEQNVPVLRTNRVMRGALLPTGVHHLVFRYRPQSVLWGGAISGLTAIGLMAGAAMVLIRPRAESPPKRH